MTSFTLPVLKYKYADLEPFIDSKTVEVHYSKHHQTYLDKLNAALALHPELPDKSILDLLQNLDQIPEDIRLAVKNMGGGYYNHNLYFSTLTPAGAKSPDFESLILQNWASWDDFKTEFMNKSTALFGSGWVWLKKNNVNKLQILSLPNQEVPDGTPVLAIDLWEHAYYLKYQNRRAEYIESWWNIVDWNQVYNNYNA